jgi:N-acetylglucosamine-6-sulfatase
MKDAVLLLLAVVAAPLCAVPSVESRPNIVFIFSDDHALQVFGAYDTWLAPFVRAHNVTPHLDRLAREGGVFLNSFCGNSLCSPSRASVLTGLHSHAHGVMLLDKPLRDGVWTYPRALNAAGYQTALFGKWHLATTMPEFATWRILPGQGEYNNPLFVSPAGNERLPGYATDVITNLSLDWLERRDKSRPFFLAVHHKAPHMNFMPPERYAHWLDDVVVPEPSTLFDDYSGRASPASLQVMRIDGPSKYEMQLDQDFKIGPRWEKNPMFAARNADFARLQPRGRDLTRWKYQTFMKDYLRCIRAIDDGVGRVLAALAAGGLDQHTIVIYSSDQGFFTGEHGWFDKRWIYEESIRMPFLVRWPGVVAPGTRFAPFIQNIDYAPTFAELAGGAAPAGLHGRSFLSVLRGRTPADWRTSVYYHYIDPGHRVAKHYGVRTGRYTLAHFWNTGEWEFFDNQKDPQQTHSVYHEPAYAPALAEAQAELARLRELYHDDTPTPFAPPKYYLEWQRAKAAPP